MSKETPLYIGNTHLFRILVTSLETNENATGGECSLTIVDAITDDEILGQTWPVTLIEDVSDSGYYETTLPNTLEVSENQSLKSIITFLLDGNTSSWVLNMKAQTRKTKITSTSTL